MNRDDILSLLRNYLAGIDTYPSLMQELSDKLESSGREVRFFKLLATQLDVLISLGVDATKHKNFEILRHSGGIYSMQCKGQGFNIRILYAFLPNSAPTLLLAFYEKEGKEKTDYTNEIPAAARRLQERKKELGYEKK